MPQPLLDKSQYDQALRDLIPILHWLTNADAAFSEEAFGTARWSLVQALFLLRRMGERSPSVKAYERWLKEDIEQPPLNESEEREMERIHDLLFPKREPT